MTHTELATWLVFLAVVILGSGIIQELRDIVKQLREIGMEIERIENHADTTSRTLLNPPN